VIIGVGGAGHRDDRALGADKPLEELSLDRLGLADSRGG
jgi:hypothetical protein